MRYLVAQPNARDKIAALLLDLTGAEIQMSA